MKRNRLPRFSRRTFLRGGVAAMTTMILPSMLPAQLSVAANRAAIDVEQGATLKVLRWRAFIEEEAKIWLRNTNRWQQLTGCQVETEFMPWEDIRPRAALDAAMGFGHDIVFGWYDDPQLYPDKLLDLTDLAQDLGRRYGGWYPVCEIYGRDPRSRRWIALPFGGSSSCINYRRSWLNEAGYGKPPQTIDELLRCCKQLKKIGRPTGFALGHAVGDANAWTHWWLWSFGGKAVEADGKTIAINSQETRRALEAVRELFDTMIPGVETWQDAGNNRAFLTGRISLTSNGTSILHAAKRDNPQLAEDIGTTNYPVGPVGRPTELSALTQAFVFRYTSYPKAARSFLQFMLEQEQYSEWLSHSSGYITQPLRTYYDLPAWTSDPRITPFRECISRMLPNSHGGPLGPKSAAAMSDYIIVDMMADACLQRHTVNGAILRAEERLARIYS